MGNLGGFESLIRQSICYHSRTDSDAQTARADLFLPKAARAKRGDIRIDQLSEDFLAREPVA
jgi:hypothetical protein